MTTQAIQTANCFQLQFRSLSREGRAYAFPCDSGGHVTMDELTDVARCNYLFARAMVGRDYAPPEVLRT